MKKILPIILLFIISNKSFSQNDEFQYVASAKDGTEVYLYFEKENDDIKEFWLKIVNPIKTGGGSSVQFYKLNCSEKTYSTSDGVIYGRNGEAIEKIYIDSYNDRIIPGTIMSAVYKYVCETE